MIALGLLGGCSTLAGFLPTIRVPVPTPCDPPKVEKPAWPVDNLADGSNVFEVARALWAEVELREGYEEKLRAAAEGCRKKPE